jgi:MtrB/PioB family decaheme-associated outer membrane protein
MNTKLLIASCVALSLVLTSGPDLFAQFVTSSAKGDLGARQFNGTLNSSKFTEYRDLPAGVFVNRFSLSFMNPDYTNIFSLWGSNVGQRDQNVAVQWGERGKYKLELEWDQIPHNYTNTARTVFSGAGGGELVMPDTIQKSMRTILTRDINPGVPGVQFDTLAITNLVLGTARGVDIVSRREKGKGVFSYAPIEELDIKLQYTNERRSGTKPLGGNFAFNPVELVEPTAYRTQEALANIEYAAKDWNVQLGYAASIFDNNVDVLVWDNPFREIDAVGAGSRGRLDLYPDNTAQKLNFSGAVSLPASTRLMTSVSYGWRKQDDRFIPYTINRVVDTMATLPRLAAASLDGKVGTTLINFSLTNRFFSSIWFTARFRSFDYDNRTPSLIFPGYVQTDNSIVSVQRRNLPIGYKKTNALVDATLRLVKDVSFKVGYERENWDRKHRDAEKTNENIYKASLDYTPRSWLLLRTSYSFGAKKTPHYDAEEVAEESFPLGEGAGTLGQLPQLRKFDMATRDRNRANVLAQITPLDFLTFTGSFGLANDKFKESEYGLLKNESNNFSFDVSFNPTYDLSFFASYTRENFNYAMKSRQRVPVAGTTRANDTTNNDWSSDLKDLANTFGLGLSWSVVPEEVDFSLDFDLSDGKGTIATRALGNPADPRFLVTTAQDYPDTRSILRQLRASIGYRLTEHFTPRLEYRFEGYSESYFNQDVIEPYMFPVDPGASGGVFLGARQPGYSAHIIYLVLSYAY